MDINLNYYNAKIEMIRNYFKHDKLFLELIMLNYDSYNLYVRIDYVKKIDSYKLRWFDLDIVNDNIEKCLSSEYVSDLLIYEIRNLCFEREPREYENIVNFENYVNLVINVNPDYNHPIKMQFKFNRYIPKELDYLSVIFIIIFGTLPKMLEDFVYELHALINDNITKFELKSNLNFNLETGNLEEIFSKEIIQKGEKLYECQQENFLEKIDNRYYGVINEDRKNLVIMEELTNNEYQIYCSCPKDNFCEHLYVIMKKIRNKQFHPFYKVIFKMDNINLIDKIMSFNYFLCLGTDGKNIEIIDNYGEITKVPILDFTGNINWEIIEDSQDKILRQAFRKNDVNAGKF